MLRLKKYSKAGFARRFARYRALFFTGLSLFFVFFLLSRHFVEIPRAVFLSDEAFLPVFFRLLWRTAPFLLTVFLLGLTIYAPACGILFSSGLGFFGGFVFFSFVKSGPWQKSVLFLTALLLFAWLFLSYASFCTLVSLRLFTDPSAGDLRSEEERVFGGTLFHSVLFQNTVNLRFLFTYTLFFFTALLLLAALAALYAYFSRLI